MAYRSRSRTTRRASAEPATSPHTPIRVLGLLLGLGLLLFRLPGATVILLAFTAARFAARRPVLSGKWPNGRPRADGPNERRLEASWRRATGWLTGGLLPTSADCTPAIALAALDWGWITMFPPVDPWRWPAAGVDAAATYLAVMAWWQSRRDLSSTVKGLDTHLRRRRVPWAKSRLPRLLAGVGVGLALGLLAWAASGRLWPAVALMAMGAGIPMIGAHRAAAAAARRDMDSALMVWRWLDALDKPPVQGMPGPVRGTETGADGSRLFMMDVPNAAEWVSENVRKALTPPAQGDGMLVGVAFDGADRTHVVVAVCPVEPPDPAALLADDVMLKSRMTVDEMRMGFMYGALSGRIVRLKTVATRKGAPAVRSFAIDGSNADWTMIGRDWLKDAAPGAFGDWMNMSGLTVTADPGGTHGWISLDREWAKDDWDADAMRPLMSDTLTDPRTHPNPVRYMNLIAEDKSMRDTLTAAYDPARLPCPARIWHDSGYRLADIDRSCAWDIGLTPMSLPQGYTVAQYMKPDLRPAFGESPIADMLPFLDPDGRPRTRMAAFVRAPRGDANRDLPVELRALTGDGEARRLLARVIVSRAAATVLKTPPTVGPAEPLGRGANVVWRMPIRLEGGVTPDDLRKAQERLKSAMGADSTIWQWRDAGHVVLWAGRIPDPDPARWRDRRDAAMLARLALDEAWAASHATGADGRPVTTRDVEPAGGSLLRAGFDLPAGLGPDTAMLRLDAFRATSGYLYARRIPGDAPLTLLLGRTDPLPERCMADWTAMADRTAGSRLPFAVGDDGGVVSFDPRDTPHLLITGQTMSGKTSAAVTLVNAALLRGWRCFVGDPVKNGNDFAAVKDKLDGFAAGLDQCVGMLKWVDEEGRRRLDLQKRYGAQNIDALPDDARPPRIIVFLDEFVSLLELSKGSKVNRTGDPDVDNAILMDQWRDTCKRAIGVAVSHILTQHRSQGITLILGSQMMKTDSMGALPDAGLAKAQLGRLFIGAGETTGNLSPRNVSEGNRLIRQQMGSGGMPKGRGLYERMGRGIQMVQCWWCGTNDDVAAHTAALPDGDRPDWTALMPARPRLVGVVDETEEHEPDRTVAVDDADDDDWSLE
ncbi:cell division protein FtsK [Bifidobacterium myosotis]|uniref:Cell division protein FtsK n=1 Tax=Bifidobacterium myosotis TaxID=1630166 RepID=A0A5M9ZL87_9BIFI|nr:cell division protein FtsK [Bifidobacterium myosotis]KAA8828199.1 cell division protein FtsK [Bifidobacterium myosotis]